jgi:hypothetical protein
LWGRYGFYDAFNLDQNWTAASYLAIDQGPIVAMIENYRTGLLWDLFMANPEIQPALTAIGFVPDASDVHEIDLLQKGFTARVTPNPALGGEIRIQLTVSSPQRLSASLYSTDGRIVQSFFSGKNFPQGEFQEKMEGLTPGVWLLKLANEKGETVARKILVIKN